MTKSKSILIDYDQTYTEMPLVFDSFIAMSESMGFTCYIVTMRPPEHPITDTPEHVPVIYTSNKAKIPYCRDELNLEFGIFIEDAPIRLYIDYDTESFISDKHGKHARPL